MSGGLVLRVTVEPDADGIVSVRHDLGGGPVNVRCERADGSGVGYRFVSYVGPGEVEVATVPGSGVSVVVIEPGEVPPD